MRLPTRLCLLVLPIAMLACNPKSRQCGSLLPIVDEAYAIDSHVLFNMEAAEYERAAERLRLEEEKAKKIEFADSTLIVDRDFFLSCIRADLEAINQCTEVQRFHKPGKTCVIPGQVGLAWQQIHDACRKVK